MITLIATRHTESGLCDLNELNKIIERISPNLISVENSPEGLAASNSGLHPDSLETKAVNLYSIKHTISHVPVDIDINKLIDINIKNQIEDMFDYFYNYPVHQELTNQHHELSNKYGFPYLNSNQCSNLLKRKYFLEKELVKNNQNHSQTFNGWTNIHEYREREMIKKIYSYSKTNKDDCALFLVGAEHRSPIIAKIAMFEEKTKSKLDWNFNYLDKYKI
ncbi:MAG: hypothetical protein IPM95_08435 [Sphingobacteriales bacterium]|jgi:hypothetical protein|nr:hypothetical protein [Sphingobacteriales bacterium]